MTEIMAFKMPCCEDIIYSMYGHDFIYCKCKKGFIDGGHTDKKTGIIIPLRCGGTAIKAKTVIIRK